MRIGLMDFKYEFSGDGKLFIRSCNTKPVEITNEAFKEAIKTPCTEMYSVNRNDETGQMYVKVECGPRAGKIWFLPKKAKTCGLMFSEDGLKAVYMINDKTTDSMLLI